MNVSLSEIARALGGRVNGRQVLAPGPGHSTKDKSLSITLSPGSAYGFLVHSHAGDDWRACRDHVAAALQLPGDRWRQERQPDPAEIERRRTAQRRAEERDQADMQARQRRAIRIWREGRDPRGTIVETYLRSRCLDLPEELAGDVLRFHGRCPWEQGTVPAMVAALRCVRTSEVVGIHRTALTSDGQKISRKMLGTAAGAAVMLDVLCAITDTLAVAEGIETALAGRQYFDLTPIWALGSSGGIANLPVLAGVKTLVVIAENDAGASAAAIEAVGTRWQAAGRGVEIVTPTPGAKDLNDAIMGGV